MQDSLRLAGYPSSMTTPGRRPSSARARAGARPVAAASGKRLAPVVYGMLKARFSKEGMFGQEFCDLLVLDEASQMNLPEAIMAALALKPDGPLIVVGDHRQMPPIVRHDWDGEPRRTFREYEVYASLFDTLRALDPPMIRFAESFRLHAAMAEFLRQEVYRHDDIPYHSKRRDRTTGPTRLKLPTTEISRASSIAVLNM